MGTGKLPSGTGGLQARASKPSSEPKAPPVPPDLIKSGISAVTEWFDNPGKLGEAPDWLVDQLLADALAYAKASGADPDPVALRKAIKGRLESFAEKFKDGKPSADDIKKFVEDTYKDLSKILADPNKAIPVI